MLRRAHHRIIRNPTFINETDNRAYNRHSPYSNTLSVLNDPKNDRQLFLIGTTNSSTLLANRTKKLILNEKPDSVFLQTSNAWCDKIQRLKNIKTQEDLQPYSYLFNSEVFDNGTENNSRGLLFKARFYSWLAVANWIKASGRDFKPFTPGLEMKLALKSAQDVNAEIILGGLELDQVTVEALKVEPYGLNPISLILAGSRGTDTLLWRSEMKDLYACLDVNGGSAFAESLDKYRVSWFVKYFEKYAPQQKKIIVDKKDLDIFYALYRNCPGKKIVAVVNQWHVPGIEAHWRHTTGTEEEQEPINPIGDFDINAHQERTLVNDLLRAYTSQITKSEPANWKDYNTVYHKDAYEPERIRHVDFSSHDDPHMNHGLPSDPHFADLTKDAPLNQPTTKVPIQIPTPQVTTETYDVLDGIPKPVGHH